MVVSETVVIPLYNHASYIVSALESVIAQGNIVREVIVIDDGSKDNSLAVAMEFAVDYPHIKVFGQKNCGAAPTLNRGVLGATAEYVAILNSDDFWAPNQAPATCQKRWTFRCRAWTLWSVRYFFINGEGTEIENTWGTKGALDNFIARRDPGLALMETNFLMTTSNFVVRRSVFTSLGGFANLRYAHDMDFGLRLVADHRRIGFIGNKLLAYRLHGANTINENHSNVRVDWAMVASFFLWSLSRKNLETAERIQQGWRILEKHGLTLAAQECVRYFDTNPSTSLANSRLLVDAPMKSKLRSAV